MGGSFGGKTEFILEPVGGVPGARDAAAGQAAVRPRGVHARDHGPPGHADHASARRARPTASCSTSRRRRRSTRARTRRAPRTTPTTCARRSPSCTACRTTTTSARSCYTNTPVGRRGPRLGRPGDRSPPSRSTSTRWPGALRIDPVDLRLKNLVAALRHRPRDRHVARGRPRARVPRARRRGLRLDRAPRARRRAGAATGAASASPAAPTRTACSASSPRPATCRSR